MKIPFIPMLVCLVVLSRPSPANAALCPQCEGKIFIQSIGTCSNCPGATSSGAFKLCKKCSAKLTQCEACQKALKPITEVTPDPGPTPGPVTDDGAKPKIKPYPAHWGAPPRNQTKDFRPLPAGYGMGSSTLAAWIQKNLDADAKVPEAGNDPAADGAAKAAEIAELEKKIADMKDLAQRARFTAEGLKKHQEQLAALQERLKLLKDGRKPAP